MDLASFIPQSFEWWHLPLVFIAGLIGESFGALVGGGSIVTVPALLATGVPITSAIAIDNAASLGTEVGIVSETKRKVLARKRLLFFMMIPMTLGGVLGTWLLLTIPHDVIRYSMAFIVIVLLIYSYVGKKPEPDKVSRTHYALLFGFLFTIGIYSNFLAAGEGAFSRMGIMMLVGISFLQVSGIKAAATMPSRIYSLIVTAFAGLIVWPYLLTMWVSNFIAGKYAMRFAKHIPERYIKVFLTVMSVMFVVYLLFYVN